MLTLSFLALSALTAAPASASVTAFDAAANHVVACNPDPSKNRGCFREFQPAKRAVKTADNRPMVTCHPEPSKNRGCLRPSHVPAVANTNEGAFAPVESAR